MKAPPPHSAPRSHNTAERRREIEKGCSASNHPHKVHERNLKCNLQGFQFLDHLLRGTMKNHNNKIEFVHALIFTNPFILDRTIS